MGPEWGHVRWLIEEPEAFPLVAGHPEIFGVHEQFLCSFGLVSRVVRQGDRGTAFAHYDEGCDHEHHGRQRFPHQGDPPAFGNRTDQSRTRSIAWFQPGETRESNKSFTNPRFRSRPHLDLIDQPSGRVWREGLSL